MRDHEGDDREGPEAHARHLRRHRRRARRARRRVGVVLARYAPSMEPRYDPHGVEVRWQETWEREGLYKAGAGARGSETFVICVPPPNVTGELHMGHALNGSMQDALIRWHRMQGYDTLWQPGDDHAAF